MDLNLQSLKVQFSGDFHTYGMPEPAKTPIADAIDQRLHWKPKLKSHPNLLVSLDLAGGSGKGAPGRV